MDIPARYRQRHADLARPRSSAVSAAASGSSFPRPRGWPPTGRPRPVGGRPDTPAVGSRPPRQSTAAEQLAFPRLDPPALYGEGTTRGGKIPFRIVQRDVVLPTPTIRGERRRPPAIARCVRTLCGAGQTAAVRIETSNSAVTSWPESFPIQPTRRSGSGRCSPARRSFCPA